jgi:predicted metal-dependent phosphoesterase TrpH
MHRPPASRGGRRVDLHAHTIFSDGALTPEAVVARAVERSLAALAITDHDSVEGLEPARLAAGSALELVPGIEVSSSLEGADLHILGYYIDPEDPQLNEALGRFREERVRRMQSMVERLSELGVGVDLDVVLELAGPGVVGRPHLAEALVRAGQVETADEAFRRFIGARGEAYVPRPRFHPERAIALIHAAGGVSVLAHPGAALSDLVVERLASAGLRGVEVWHPQHGAASVRRFRGLARKLGLLETGGSDYHGWPRGTELGELSVPASVLGPLKQAAGVPG